MLLDLTMIKITKNNELELVNSLKGFVTIKMIENRLGINRTRAIYLIHKLRKKGYVITKAQPNKMRVYYISPNNVLKGTSYIEIINKYAPTAGIKLVAEDYVIYGKTPSIEETLIYAIKKNDIRFVIASLALFRGVKDWSELYQLAKKNNLIREIAALYDVSRLILPKLRKMPKRFKNLALPKKTDKYKYIIKKFNSDDSPIQKIEKKWKVYIPLNFADLREYKYD